VASIPAWLKPSKTVPHAPWSAHGSMWKAKPTTYFMLLLGLWLFGTGEAALVAANAGQSPWVVFAEGLSIQTGLSIGWATALISVCVLTFWIPLKRKPGAGTLLNVIVIALALEVMIPVFPQPTTAIPQLAQTFAGIVIVGIGSAFYIPAHLGPGPRDGLMTGLHFKTGIPVARIRLSIEVVVLTLGWLLGGTLGIGTFLFAALVGYSIAFWFGVVHRVDQSISK
jgi:uncharacterized membrane protein YczE